MRRWWEVKEETGKNLVKNDANLLTHLLSSFWSDVRHKSKPRTIDIGEYCASQWDPQVPWQNWRISWAHASMFCDFFRGLCWIYPVQFLWLRWMGVSVRDIRFLWRKKRGEEGGRHSSCQISAPAPAFIQTRISYMLAMWQATNDLLFPFTHIPFLHVCLLCSGVRLQRLLCSDPIGGISLQACAIRRYLTFCLHSLKMCAFLSEYCRLTLYWALNQNKDVLFKKA